MDFISQMKRLASENKKTIVLPESTDIRVIKAAREITDEGFANVILIGDKEEINRISEGVDVSDITIINPLSSEKYLEYATAFYELRKSKGMTEEGAKETLKNNIYYGTMMVKMGDADGLVCGSVCSTSDTLRPALQILKTAPNTKLVSALFMMIIPNCKYGEDGVFLFSDCGLVPNPSADELSEIALALCSFRSNRTTLIFTARSLCFRIW